MKEVRLTTSSSGQGTTTSGLPSSTRRRTSSTYDRSSSLTGRRLRDRNETVEEAFSKQIAILKNNNVGDLTSSSDASLASSGTSYEPSVFRPETAAPKQGLESRSRKSKSDSDRFRALGTGIILSNHFAPKIDLKIHLVPDQPGPISVPRYLDTEMDTPTKEFDLKSRPRPGSGQEKRVGRLSNGPIVSSIDDRRRPQPLRRTTVGPVESSVPTVLKFDDKIKNGSTVSNPGNGNAYRPRRTNPDFYSETSSSTESSVSDARDVVLNPRTKATSKLSIEESFFSYISPDIEQIRAAEVPPIRPPPVQKFLSEKSSTKTATTTTTTTNAKSLTNKMNAMELSEIEDDELEDTGRLVISRPIGGVASLKGDPITIGLAIELKQLLFGNANRDFPPGWKNQAFEFNDRDMLKFGLVQHRGGPCGILASVQAFILRFLIFKDDQESDNHVADLELRALSPISSTRNDALVEAMHHILTKCAARDDDHDDFVTSGDVIVALPGTRSHFQGFPGKYKTDGATETLTIFRFPGSESSSSSSQNLRKFLDHHAPFFTGKGNSAVVAFLYSAILTRGIEAIKDDDMDSSEVPLMGAHGYCSQEMVNLMLTGKATSNTFDGTKNFDTLILKGINAKVDIGFMSLFEHYGSCIVGDFLKAPNFPIWVVCSESHFTVVFGLHRGDEVTSTADRKVVDLIYYDELGRQDEPVRIGIESSTASGHFFSSKNESGIVSPIEHCLRTKWTDAKITWKSGDPVL